MPPGRSHPVDATRPMPPGLASVVYTFEALAGSWGSVSAPAVSRIMGGAERKKIATNIGETRRGPCQHGFMCGCRQWSTDINESNYNMQPITIKFAVRVRKDYVPAGFDSLLPSFASVFRRRH